MQQVLIAERYRLLHSVGTGGMGRVWLARDEMLHRDVAVKEVLPPHWMTADERNELRGRTLREARTAARLSHPNVVQIYDVVHAAGSPWIIMEYVRSRSLHQVITEDGPLSPQRAAGVGLAVLAGLRAAHRAGVLHRDVKPHNVLLADDGRVVLTDFGLATFEEDGALTRGGLVMGSPQYVAPERAADGASTVETDMWSLGATLYAAVEGRSPYARTTTMATLTALATSQPDPAPHAGPLRPVLTGLLRRDPRQRLAAAEVERLLRRVTDPPPTTRSRLLPRPRPRRGAYAPATPQPPVPHRATAPAGGPPAVPPDAPGSGAPDRRTSKRRIAAAGFALVLIAVAGTALAINRQPHRQPRTTAATGPPPTVAAAVLPCTGQPPADAATIGPAAIPSDEPFALVPNWSWHTDPAGFRIAAPIGWQYFTDGAVRCFRDPRGARLLSVDPSIPPVADAVQHWRQEEARLTGAGLLPGYERVAIGPLSYYQGGAEWEFRWRDASGEPSHLSQMLVKTSTTRAYVVSWRTPEFDWQVNLPFLRMVRLSLRPAGSNPG